MEQLTSVMRVIKQQSPGHMDCRSGKCHTCMGQHEVAGLLLLGGHADKHLSAAQQLRFGLLRTLNEAALQRQPMTTLHGSL